VLYWVVSMEARRSAHDLTLTLAHTHAYVHAHPLSQCQRDPSLVPSLPQSNCAAAGLELGFALRVS